MRLIQKTERKSILVQSCASILKIQFCFCANSESFLTLKHTTNGKGTEKEIKNANEISQVTIWHEFVTTENGGGNTPNFR